MKKHLLVVAFLALAVSLSFQGTRGLYETSEGRYAESAREMLETGNFLEPTLGYKSHWTKPPMTYWAIAAGIKILGPGEWGIRLYNAVAFFLTVLAVTAIGTEMWDRRTGLVAGLIYLSSPFPVFGANSVTTDTLLTLWEISAVLCYIKTRRAAQQPDQAKWAIAMWLFFGLGFLTKGPPVMLPLIPIAVWQFLNRHQDRISIANPAGILLFSLVGFSWYIIVCIRNPGLLSYFIGTEVVNRVASDAVHNPEWYAPFWLYLPALSIGSGAWLYPGLKTVITERLYKPAMLLDCLKKKEYSAFLLLWLLIPLFIFFLVKSRLYLYVLPLYAPVALGIARAVCRKLDETAALPRYIIGTAICSAVVIIIAKGFFSYWHHPKNVKYLYESYCAVKKENTVAVIYQKRKLYGFQYYLNGPLPRISRAGKKDWAEYDEPEGEANRKLNSYIFLTDTDKEADLCNELSEAGLNGQRFESGDYVLFLVETEKKFLYKNQLSENSFEER